MHGVFPLCAALFFLSLSVAATAQMGVSTPLSPEERKKAEAE
jgi:hypothetical protein